jgi:hypothetical protein
MKKLVRGWLALLLALSAGAGQAAEASLSMVYSNALGDDLPFSIFSKHKWSPDPGARFVKLHMYFDAPIMVQGLSIDTCGSRMQPELSIFFNFDQWLLRTTPRLDGEVPSALHPERSGNLLVLRDFDKPLELRSLTINFEHNSGFSICGINIKNPRGETYNIKTPELVKGTVTASSTLAPASAYDAIYLFDSRFEYGWASNKQAKNVDLDFAFDKPQRIEKIMMWNGYQRSVMHCISNSRAKRLRITGDSGYDEQVTVKDALGSQVIVLPRPFEGRNLKIEVLDSFLGKSYPDLVISELRFNDGNGWFMLDSSARLKENLAANRASFEKAGVRALLNDSYTASTDTDEAMKEAGDWISSTLRFRADGSFYISNQLEGDQGYFALGNYEIKSADKDGLKLRVFGLYYETQTYGDCNGCGRDCNKLNQPDENGVTEIQKIFQETFVIKPGKDGKIIVQNPGGGKKIQFKRLTYSREP